MTNLHNDFYAALSAGASSAELLRLVCLYKANGVSQRETYKVLEAIRKELGCNADEANQLCETLEAVMDRVWGYCSKADAIWETTLSDSNPDMPLAR